MAVCAGMAEARRKPDLCMRYFQRHDGTILLADCEIGVKRRRRCRVATAAAALLATGHP